MFDWEKLGELLGHDGDPLTDETALEAVEVALKSRSTEKDKLKALCDELKGERDSLTAKIKDLEKGGTPEPDQEILDDRAETVTEKLESLVEAGKVTPAVGTKLASILCGEVSKRPAYMLSRKVSGTSDSVAKQIIAALAENDLVRLGEKTGHQVLKMSRKTPGDEEDYDPKVTEMMLKM